MTLARKLSMRSEACDTIRREMREILVILWQNTGNTEFQTAILYLL